MGCNLESQNKENGFYRTMILGLNENQNAPEMDIKAIWALTMDKLSQVVSTTSEAIRAFLDSRHGRHFADEVLNQLSGQNSEDLPLAIDKAIALHMKWKISANHARETGIPKGLPYLVGLIWHEENIAEF